MSAPPRSGAGRVLLVLGSDPLSHRPDSPGNPAKGHLLVDAHHTLSAGRLQARGWSVNSALVPVDAEYGPAQASGL